MNLEQFRDHLATTIGIKGRGNTLTDDDANYLETIITAAHDELEQLSVAIWSLDDIPAYAIRGFTIYCKSALERYGFDQNPVLMDAGLAILRYMTADPRHGVGTAEYF